MGRLSEFKDTEMFMQLCYLRKCHFTPISAPNQMVAQHLDASQKSASLPKDEDLVEGSEPVPKSEIQKYPKYGPYGYGGYAGYNAIDFGDD